MTQDSTEAGVADESRRPRRIPPGVRLILAAAVLAVLIATFVARIYAIPSESMETTLHGCPGCENDRVLVDRLSYRFTDPEPGDIVVFSAPESWQNSELPAPPATPNPLVKGLQAIAALFGAAQPGETDFVKRVIAVGGQTVSCCDERNRVVVDGVPLDEPYVYYDPAFGPAQQEPFGPVQVPPGQLWVMGDNRNSSIDSRAPGNGPVPMAHVIGEARMIVLPLSRFGFLDSPSQ